MFIWRWWGGKVGSSGFSGSSTAEQVTHGIDVSALTAIVTGLVRNNAGVMATPFALSRDIIELQFATNHAEGAEITANSLHPGAVMTNLFRYNSFVNGLVDIFGRCVLKNVEQEAATTCYVALHPQVQGKSGRYFADSNLAEACSQANDAELANKLL